MPCPDCNSTTQQHYSWCKIHLEEYGNFTDWDSVYKERMRIKQLFKQKGVESK
jgi:hypothetical protein